MIPEGSLRLIEAMHRMRSRLNAAKDVNLCVTGRVMRDSLLEIIDAEIGVQQPPVVVFAGRRVDTVDCRAEWADSGRVLSNKLQLSTVRLIREFHRNPGRVLSNDHLFKVVTCRRYALRSSECVRSSIKRMRRALDIRPDQFIINLNRRGYMYDPEAK